MEDEESYSHSVGIPIASGSPLARALSFQSSCLQKRSIQELYNHLAVLYYLKSQTSHQNPSIPKRVKPPVPKFEEPIRKVVKTDCTVNRVYPVDLVSELDGFGSTSRSERSTSSKVTQSICETQSISDLISSNFGQSDPLEAVKLDDLSLISVKEEENDVKTEAPSEEHDDLESPPMIDSPPLSSTCVSLDRKDMKKFQKFVELCEDYQTKLNISNPQVFEKFKQLTTLVIPKLLSHFKSKPFESVAAAVLLYACREVSYPITLKQIVSISDAKEKLVNKCVFTLKEILPSNTEVKHFKAGEFIKVMADKLKLDERVRAGAVKIWENIERLNFMKSIHAVTLAACCLKFACSLSDSDKEFAILATAAGITKMTLKNMYRELFPYRFYFITADCMLRDPKELKFL